MALKPAMEKAIVSLCKALAQVMDAHWRSYDRESSDLMAALAAYVAKHGDRP